MSKRMTDERLEEIDSLEWIKGYFGGVGPIAGELLQALKAEREYCRSLEGRMSMSEGDFMPYRKTADGAIKDTNTGICTRDEK